MIKNTNKLMLLFVSLLCALSCNNSKTNNVDPLEIELLNILTKTKISQIQSFQKDTLDDYWYAKAEELDAKIEELIKKNDDSQLFAEYLEGFSAYINKNVTFRNSLIKGHTLELINNINTGNESRKAAVKILRFVEYIILDYYYEIIINEHFIFDNVEIKIVSIPKGIINYNDEYQAEIIVAGGNEYKKLFAVIDGDTLSYNDKTNVFFYKCKPKNHGVNLLRGHVLFPDNNSNLYKTKIPFNIEFIAD